MIRILSIWIASALGLLAADRITTLDPTWVGRLGDFTVAEPPLLLDKVPAGFAGAYCWTHRISTNHTGPIFTAGIIGSSATNDIPYRSDNHTDTNVLMSFAASNGGNAWGIRVYDQTTADWDLQTTETNRWLLVVSNNVLVLGPDSKYFSPTWNGVTNRLANVSAPTVNPPFYYFTAIRQRTLVVGDFILGGNGTTQGLRQTTGNAIRLNHGATALDTGALSLNTWYLITAMVVGTTSDYIQVGTGTPTVADAGNNAITGGFYWGSITICPAFDSPIWLIYSGTLSDPDRLIIQQEINALYGNTLY